jgi:hypothetical protein
MIKLTKDEIKRIAALRYTKPYNTYIVLLAFIAFVWFIAWILYTDTSEYTLTTVITIFISILPLAIWFIWMTKLLINQDKYAEEFTEEHTAFIDKELIIKEG